MNPDALKHAMEQIKMDGDMRARVLRRSLSAREEHDTMKRKPNCKRIIAVGVAVAAALALSVTAFAAAKSQIFISWLDNEITYETAREAQTALEESGGTLHLPQTFSNGYVFETATLEHQLAGVIQEDGDLPENGTMIREEDGITYLLSDDGENLCCTYRREGQTVTLSAIDGGVLNIPEEAADTMERNGHRLYFLQGFTATEDSSVSEEDLERGNYSASTTVELRDGSDVETQDLAKMRATLVVGWEQDGKLYLLNTPDESLTRDDLVEMAMELIGE